MFECSSLEEPELIKLIVGGAVGVLPTDTVYGLTCLAANRASVARLYKLKSRDQKPGTIIAADVQQLVELGLKRRYLSAVTQYWPSAISVIIPCGDELRFLHIGQNGLAVRIPEDKALSKLLSKTGPLLTTSANHPGEPTASTIMEAQQYFNGQVDFYVDGGDLSKRAPSTIIRIVDDAIEVIRSGAVTINPVTGEIKK
jgi:L-threonylcarbamoyladenylate synthase